MTSLPNDIDGNFVPSLLSVAKQLGADPVDLASILFSESGLHHTAKNSIGCVGINQFCPSTAAGMGITDLEAYRQLPPSQQLCPYVFHFWRALISAHHADPTARDIYWLNFLPATYVKGAPDSHVITSSPSIVSANPGFAGGKGFITAGDLQDAIDRATANGGARWAAIKDAITSAEPISQRFANAAKVTAFVFFLAGSLGYAAWRGAL